MNHTMAGLHRAGPASPPEHWPQRSFCERLGVVVIVLLVGELQPFAECNFCVGPEADNVGYVLANINADRGQGRRYNPKLDLI